jgi:hypothetical protein
MWDENEKDDIIDFSLYFVLYRTHVNINIWQFLCHKIFINNPFSNFEKRNTCLLLPETIKPVLYMQVLISSALYNNSNHK